MINKVCSNNDTGKVRQASQDFSDPGEDAHTDRGGTVWREQ